MINSAESGGPHHNILNNKQFKLKEANKNVVLLVTEL
jgi:hypothetical protein